MKHCSNFDFNLFIVIQSKCRKKAELTDPSRRIVTNNPNPQTPNRKQTTQNPAKNQVTKRLQPLGQ
jgi:hypothetical protein